MMRNDYRRSLILLRGNAPAYSGHVRLERRTMMGSMDFLLQTPTQCAGLRIALVGRGRNGYFACALGEAQRDPRGQAALHVNFDPRNMCGHELEEYRLIAVTCAESTDCGIVLYGNLSGHAEMNWDEVRAAVCSLYGGTEEAEDSGVQTLPLAETENADDIDNVDNTDDPEDDVCDGELTDEAADENGQAGDETETPQTAGERLSIDMDRPWPESIEALRPLFRLSVPMEGAPDHEYVYISAAMPPESGYAYCAVGVRAENGAPVSVRYGLPAQWTVDPPAGLEEYAWVGDHNRGWWMTQIDLQDGMGD